MNFKGHTKIELFNAETGELEQEIHEDNMITNAISRALNPPIDFLIDTSVSLNEVLGNVMPIQSLGMGGVMLFKNNITEDKDAIRLPKDNNVIGYAGSAYSGTDTYRGTYNSNESKALTNGYRHVWDFATDRACGDISCVCLTHQTGGNTGNRFTDSIYSSLSLGSCLETYSSYGYGSCIGLVDKGICCFARMESATSITLTYALGFNSDKITLSRNPNYFATSIDSQVTISFSNASFPTSLSSIRYYVDKNGILVLCYSSGNVINYCRINILTKTLVEDGTLSVNSDSFPTDEYNVSYNFSVLFCIGDYYIGRMKRLSSVSDYNSSYPYVNVAVDKSGNYIQRIGTTTYSNTSMSNIIYDTQLDAVQISYNNWVDSALKYFRNYYPICSLNESSTYGSVYSYIDIYPYFLRRGSSSSRDGIGLLLSTAYLASINNLATTVTKTNQQTMKITYDITEE